LLESPATRERMDTLHNAFGSWLGESLNIESDIALRTVLQARVGCHAQRQAHRSGKASLRHRAVVLVDRKRGKGGLLRDDYPPGNTPRRENAAAGFHWEQESRLMQIRTQNHTGSPPWHL